MLSLIDNDDELALVMGHEISHLVLGHLSDQTMLETMLRTVEVLLLSMDPTEGLLALGVVGTLATLRTAVVAAHSREHEREADVLGMQLAAMACFNTQTAALVFDKLRKMEAQPSAKWLMPSFADSHPSSADRYEALVRVSDSENAGKYEDCQGVMRRWKQTFG